ncbi:hypothetical protein CsatB_011266 [Cannabis sativa]
MDYRSTEGFVKQPSDPRLLRDHQRLELVPPDSYEQVDRREPPPPPPPLWSQRSVSPHGLPQDAAVIQRTSIERRDHGWPNLDRGRTARIRSRSPQAMVSGGDPRKRPHFDDGVGIPQKYSPTPSTTELRQRSELIEPSNVNLNNDSADLHARRVYGYEHSDPSYSKDEFSNISLSAGDKHRSLSQKSVVVEDSMEAGSYCSPQKNLGRSSVYGDASGHLPSYSRTMDPQQHFELERHQYRDSINLNRLPVTQSYKDEDKPALHTGDASYVTRQGSNSKRLASSSLGTSRNEFLAYQDGHTNELKGSTKLTEAVGLSGYKERPILDWSRDPEGVQRNQIFYRRACSPDENYIFTKSHEKVDDHGYPDDEFRKMMSPRGEPDYSRAQIIYDHRDTSRPSIARPAIDRNDNIDDPRGYLRKGMASYNPALEKHSDPDYIDMRRTSHISKQGREYLSSGFTHIEAGRTGSQDREILHLGASKGHQIDYGFGSDAGPQFQEERLIRTPVPKYENDINRHNARVQNMRDVNVYNPRVQNARDDLVYNARVQKVRDEAEYETEMHRHSARVQNVRDEGEYETEMHRHNARVQSVRNEGEYEAEMHRHNARLQNVRDEGEYETDMRMHKARVQNVRDEGEYEAEMHRHNARVQNVRDEGEYDTEMRMHNARVQNVSDEAEYEAEVHRHNARVQNEHAIYNARGQNVGGEHRLFNARVQNRRDDRRYNARVQNEHAIYNRRDEPGMYKSQDRMVKRRYDIQEDVSTYNSRTTTSGKLYTARQFQDLHETNEEWISEEMSDLYTPRTTEFQNNGYRRSQRNYEGPNHTEDFVSDEWYSSQELPHARKQSTGYYKNYGRQIKSHRRPGYSSHYNSYQYDRKNHINRQQKFWKRNDGYYEDKDNDGNPSEDWVAPEESEPNEDSEEFKQLVHEAFLKYAKKLNVNTSVQKRYREDGRAGSLFCIVCGRSGSKEFMDTRRLVTHAYMSHKAGLRAEHLGLHKAICVLLGWSTVIPDETVTWAPQILPKSEALSQKEDLIIWPPVIIIHNITFWDNNPEKWKVVTVDALEAFIRGKGLIRGRIKVCLGKPIDQSVMVVKFLGTFTGLGDAEKLHKFFMECKRGRSEFELATSNNGTVSVNGETEIEGGKLEENILYGYLGISEDLDKVDFTSRNTGLIKSKMEILDLANAPVKPEET